MSLVRGVLLASGLLFVPFGVWGLVQPALGGAGATRTLGIVLDGASGSAVAAPLVFELGIAVLAGYALARGGATDLVDDADAATLRFRALRRRRSADRRRAPRLRR